MKGFLNSLVALLAFASGSLQAFGSDRCCVCEYEAVPQCSAIKDPDSCQKRLDSDGCEWRNQSCVSRHETDCKTWLASQPRKNWCQRVSLLAVEKMNPTGGLSACREFWHNYQGHGLGLKFANFQVGFSLASLPDATSLKFDDASCSTFENISESRLAMKQLQRLLKADQRVEYSGNQALVSTEYQARYSFTFSNDTFEERAGDCHSGSVCFTPGSRVLCRKPQGTTSQLCCPGWSGLKWRVGALQCD